MRDEGIPVVLYDIFTQILPAADIDKRKIQKKKNSRAT